MAASSSSSSASMVKALSPRVFLNFHGYDLRKKYFINHLEKALRDEGIEYFFYNQTKVYLDILYKEIDDSNIALTIFSERYSEYNWCLNELVKIMENVEDNKLKVFPIFYNVKESDVRYSAGEFGNNLYKGGDRDRDRDRTNMWKWESALRSVTNTKGLTSTDFRTDEDLILNIVLEIRKMLTQHRLLEMKNQIDQELKRSEEKYGSERAKGPTGDDNTSILPPHQVFISFRGEQLRNNFISHLVGALRRSMVKVFIDTQENKGEDISNLLKRIENSTIVIVVFSTKYTESKWCLREAEKIAERAAQGKLKVLPIFYKVTPTNVKKLKGEFGDNFRDREWDYRNDRSVIEKWKEALAYIAGIIGSELNDQSDENDSITLIVNEVIKMLTSIPSGNIECIVQ